MRRDTRAAGGDAIRRRPAERDALADAAVRAFCLTNANLRASEQSLWFVGNLQRILRRAETTPGIHLRRLAEQVLGLFECVRPLAEAERCEPPQTPTWKAGHMTDRRCRFGPAAKIEMIRRRQRVVSFDRWFDGLLTDDGQDGLGPLATGRPRAARGLLLSAAPAADSKDVSLVVERRG
ncbi:hypothetical protein [Baekduia alba]|uniref:hypothetical protein n=1 Tax=Baekduia alba TaxID=2997333 RepID=UPI002340FEFE|nr:hypothetical protein [Baekduia alba]